MNSAQKVLRFWPWLAAVASGLLCSASLPPCEIWWLCWIALTPLLSALWFSGENSKRRWRRDLALGYVAGLAFFWPTFSWLTTVTTPGWFLVGAYMSIYFALWAWLCGMLRPTFRALIERPTEARKSDSAGKTKTPLAGSPWLRSTNNLRLAFLLACGWVAQELLRSVVFSGWGWNTLGTPLHGQWYLIQIVEWTGVAGLSFLVAFANVIAVATVRRFVLEGRVGITRPHYDFTLTLVMLVAVAGYGIRAVRTHYPAQAFRVAMVQSNIPREEKFSREFAQKIFDQFTRLSEIALHTQAQPDLLMWPESSMPGPVLEDEESYRFVTEFVARAKTDLMLGAIDEDQNRAYNAALFVSGAGQQIQLYRKMHLVPFGEYIPGRHTIPFLAQVVGNQVPDDFAFGRDPTVFRATNPAVKIAPLICFEDTIGDLTRQFVLRGANLLANVTNDGWFLRSAGSAQHLANAVFRCVETRRPMARAANTGATCFISEYGRITQILLDENGSQFTEGVLAAQLNVPTGNFLTFYVRHGELFAYCCAAITAATLLFYAPRFVRRMRPRKKTISR